MPSKQADFDEFRRLLARGAVQRGYRAILSFMTRLRTHFENNLADCAASEIYQGKLDITHFAVFSPLLKQNNLKVVIVFNYKAFRFEAWLVGRNRKIHQQYWELFRRRAWPKYRVKKPATGVFSILECDLAADFDLDEPDKLTSTIATGAVAFIHDIESFLWECPPQRSARH